MGRIFWICLFTVTLVSPRVNLFAQPLLPNTPDSLVVADTNSVSLLTIGNISIEGNYRTRTPIILREMALKPGDELFEKELIDRLEIDRRKIVNTNLFISVEMKYFQDLEDKTLINIRIVVKERWYFITLPVFQLADRNFNEWWYDRDRDIRRVTYGLYMSYRNLTGRADQLRLLAEFGFVPKYEISYSLPYIDKAQKTGVTTGISYTTNKTMPFRTWNDKLDYFNSENLNRERFYTFINFTRRNQFYAFHSIDFRWNYLELSDTITRLNPNYLLNAQKSQAYFQLTYTYNYDRRDNVQYPLCGFNYGFQASKLGLFPTDNLNQAYLNGWYRRYIPVGNRWFFNSGIKFRLSAPVRQPYPQTIGLGYRLNLVRGYELYVIDGQHYGLWENEFKYRLFDFEKTIPWLPIRQFNTIPITAYLNSFTDLGYVKNYYPEFSNTSLGNKLLIGAGLGLDVVTFYNMIFRFNYTINGLGERRFFFQVGRSF